MKPCGFLLCAGVPAGRDRQPWALLSLAHAHPCHVLWDVAGMPCGALTPPSSGLEPWTLTRQSEGSVALEQLGS